MLLYATKSMYTESIPFDSWAARECCSNAGGGVRRRRVAARGAPSTARTLAAPPGTLRSYSFVCLFRCHLLDLFARARAQLWFDRDDDVARSARNLFAGTIARVIYIYLECVLASQQTVIRCVHGGRCRRRPRRRLCGIGCSG
jgi:hypothetical protein